MLTNEKAIQMFIHCARCLREKPSGVSPREWSQLEVGWTVAGFQVWCRRHEHNVMHVDLGLHLPVVELVAGDVDLVQRAGDATPGTDVDLVQRAGDATPRGMPPEPQCSECGHACELHSRKKGCCVVSKREGETTLVVCECERDERDIDPRATFRLTDRF